MAIHDSNHTASNVVQIINDWDIYRVVLWDEGIDSKYKKYDDAVQFALTVAYYYGTYVKSCRYSENGVVCYYPEHDDDFSLELAV